MSPYEIELAALEEKIQPLADRRSELKALILAVNSPFKVGQVIQWIHGRNDIRRGKVEQIRPWVCDSTCWMVRVIRKNGTFGALVEIREYNKPVLVT